MKKISIFLAILSLCLFSLCGCKKTNPLYEHVSELRQTIFIGSSDNLTLKAGYGFKETPFINDKKVSDKICFLDFRLLDKENDDISYSLSFDFKEKTYTANFKLDPIKDTVSAMVEIEDFNLKEFPVTVSFGGERQEILLKSIVPENTISYLTALDHLYNKQSDLIKSFSNQNGKFNAEIHIRIVVKDEKPYWFVGIASGEERLKALLIDGFSGELLAVREVF